MSIATSIHQLYIGYFGRPADKFGFNHWEGLAVGSGVGQVAKAFAGSAEFNAVLGRSSVHFVDAVYNNLFGRLPDQATRDTWLARIARDDAPLEKFVSEMIAAASGADADTLALKTAAAASFTAGLELLGDSANLLIPSPTLQLTGGNYLAAVKDSASLDAALTGLADTIMTLPIAINPSAALVPVQPLTLDRSNLTQEIQVLYIGYFGRPADPLGFAYWETIVASSGLSAIRTAFTQSQEFSVQTQGLSPAHVINSVYLNSFGRDADLKGLAYWAGLLSDKAITIEKVVESVQGGAVGSDAIALRNKVIASSSLTATVDAVDLIPHWGGIQGATAKAFLAAVGDELSLETMLGSVVETARIIGGLEPPVPLPLF
jgi:hypothetical protein